MNITKFMTAEHGKMLALLDKLNKEKTEENFNKLKSFFDRHIMAEEKAIIILERKGKQFGEMSIILEQHEEMLDIMKNLVEEIKIGASPDNFIKKLLNHMKTHIQLENKKFYPKLDDKLTEEEHKVIYEELHDFILGNIGK